MVFYFVRIFQWGMSVRTWCCHLDIFLLVDTWREEIVDIKYLKQTIITFKFEPIKEISVWGEQIHELQRFVKKLMQMMI